MSREEGLQAFAVILILQDSFYQKTPTLRQVPGVFPGDSCISTQQCNFGAHPQIKFAARIRFR